MGDDMWRPSWSDVAFWQVFGVLSLVVAGGAGAGELNPTRPADEPAAEPAPLAPSSIAIPISVPLEVLRTAANEAIDRRWEEWGAWIRPSHACLKYKVERGDVKVGGAGGRLDLNIPGHLWVEGCFSVNNHACVPCGSCDADFNAPMHADFALKTDWRLELSGVNDGVRINTCPITVINYDIQGHIARASNPHIDRAMGRVVEKAREQLSFKPQAEALWKQAHGPLRVRDGLWLQLNPKGIRASQPRIDGSFLRASIGVVVEPVLALSEARPLSSEALPLPPLELTEPGDDFSVSMEARLDFDSASEVLHQRLVGRRYSFTHKGTTRWIKIKKAAVSGNGRSVVLQLDVEEDIQGTLYFTGMPRYDAERSLLWIEGLDYSVDTQQAVINAADWMMHEKWQEKLAKEAQWSLGPQLEDAKTDLQAALNRKYGNVALTGSLDRLRVLSVSTTPKQCIVRVAASGSLRASYVP